MFRWRLLLGFGNWRNDSQVIAWNLDACSFSGIDCLPNYDSSAVDDAPGDADNDDDW